VVTLPATVVTLGLFLFVINAIIILMASGIVNGFEVNNFGSALLFSLVLTAVNYLLELPNRYLQRKELRKRRDDDTDDEGFTPYEEIKD
jgi:putative membrane protein